MLWEPTSGPNLRNLLLLIVGLTGGSEDRIADVILNENDLSTLFINLVRFSQAVGLILEFIRQERVHQASFGTQVS